jgi:ornithine cyclodeaminase
MLIIRHHEVRDLLSGREQDVVAAVRNAYLLHHAGKSTLPHSTFLRLPAAAGESETANRIIGLPGYLGGDVAIAGLKWIASFPGNFARGVERASAVLVLNSLRTGRPEALLEASLISAARTAASAALAADLLVPAGQRERLAVTLIGCGTINLTVLRYLRAVFPTLTDVALYDAVPQRAAAFVTRAGEIMDGLTVTVLDEPAEAVTVHPVMSIATTASVPHLDLDQAPADATVLHISLRDLTVRTILDHHNITDDVDHVCRERTSLHLAELGSGNRSFIDTTVGELASEGGPFVRQPGKAVIFSPFGLGVLDLAVAKLVRDEAQRLGMGVRVDDFLDRTDSPV